MGSRRIELPFEELFKAHPFALEANVVTPGANPRETLEVIHALYDAARRPQNDEPNRENQQHLQGRLAEIGTVRMVPEDQ